METVLHSARSHPKEQDVFRKISLTALLAGTLDIIAANIQFYISTNHAATLKLTGKETPLSFITYLTHGGPEKVFRYIATAVFDTSTNEKLLVAWGVVFHFMITFLFTAALFLIYPKLSKRLRNKYIVALLYGLVIWTLMNLVVVPLSNHSKFPSDLAGALIGELVLTATIAIPVALTAHRFYARKSSG